VAARVSAIRRVSVQHNGLPAGGIRFTVLKAGWHGCKSMAERRRQQADRGFARRFRGPLVAGARYRRPLERGLSAGGKCPRLASNGPAGATLPTASARGGHLVKVEMAVAHQRRAKRFAVSAIWRRSDTVRLRRDCAKAGEEAAVLLTMEESPKRGWSGPLNCRGNRMRRARKPRGAALTRSLGLEPPPAPPCERGGGQGRRGQAETEQDEAEHKSTRRRAAPGEHKKHRLAGGGARRADTGLTKEMRHGSQRPTNSKLPRLARCRRARETTTAGS